MSDKPTSAPPASTRYAWAAVGMLWCISFFNYADRQAVFSVFPLLGKEMDLGPLEKGMLGSSFAVVYGLCAPVAGAVVDRVRRKSAILVGLYVWSAICMATAVSQRLWHLLFFRAAEGLGETCYYPAATSMLSDYHGSATRSRALGLHQTSVYAGTIAGGFFAGWIGKRFGWRSSFVVFGGLGIVLGIVLQRFLHEPLRGAADGLQPAADEQKPGVRETLRVVFGTPTVVLLMLAFICANFVAMVLLTWMPTYLYDRFDLDLAMAGLTATAFPQIASLIGAIVGGWLADWGRRLTPGGRIYVQLLGVLGGAPFMYLCGNTVEFMAVAAALTAWGLFKGLYDANIFAAVFDVVRPEYRGSVAGWMNMVGWLFGGALAPVVVGYLAERHGLGIAISLAAVVYLLAGVLLIIAGTLYVRRDLMKMER
jgi:MFS family permease